MSHDRQNHTGRTNVIYILMDDKVEAWLNQPEKKKVKDLKLKSGLRVRNDILGWTMAGIG